MLNAFTIATNDQSMVFLGQIFGNVGVVLPGTGGVLLATMFKTFNSALLIIGVLIVAYTTIVGTIATAQEGTFLGKSFDSVWVPIRTVAGIIGLMPTGSGYCAAQVLIMWAIVQGVGAADMVWATTLKYFSSGGSIATVSVYEKEELSIWGKLLSAVPGGAIAANETSGTALQDKTYGFGESGPSLSDIGNTFHVQLKQLFANLVCSAGIAKVTANEVDAKPVLQYFGPDEPTWGQTYSNGYVFDSGKTGICGYISWGIPSKYAISLGLGDAMRDGQTQAMKAVVPVIANIANYYVNKVIAADECWSTENLYPSSTDAGGKPVQCNPAKSAKPGADKNADDYCTYFDRYRSFKTNPACGWVATPIAKAKLDQILSYSGSNFMVDVTKLMYGYANNYIVEFNMKTGKSALANPWEGIIFQKATNQGWIFAGALYYYIAQRRNAGVDQYNEFVKGIQAAAPKLLTDPTIAANVPDIVKSNPFVISTPSENVPNMYTAALDIAGSILGAGQQAEGLGGGMISQSQGVVPSQAKDVWGNVDNAASEMVNKFADLLTPEAGEDPIVRIHDFGHSLLVGAEVMFFAFLGAVIGLGFLSAVVVILGTTPMPFLSGIADSLEKWFYPIVMLLLGYFILVGGALGIYLPLIPYLLFTFGSLGWFIAVIEAMVAAPIVALGLLAPGGQHKLLGKAEQAPMMLLNVFLRPTLMIFGLMTAMLLARVMVRIISAGFGGVVGSMGMNMGIIEAYLFLIVFAGIIIVALNKCYTLIYWLPNKVLTWIGGHATDFGEAQALGEVKGMAQTGTKAVGKEVGAGLQGSMKVGKEVNAALDKVGEAMSGGGGGGSGGMGSVGGGGGGGGKSGGGQPPGGGGQPPAGGGQPPQGGGSSIAGAPQVPPGGAPPGGPQGGEQK